MKMCSLGAMLFHSDGQTDRQMDMTKLIIVSPPLFFSILQMCLKVSIASFI